MRVGVGLFTAPFTVQITGSVEKVCIILSSRAKKLEEEVLVGVSSGSTVYNQINGSVVKESITLSSRAKKKRNKTKNKSDCGRTVHSSDRWFGVCYGQAR